MNVIVSRTEPAGREKLQTEGSYVCVSCGDIDRLQEASSTVSARDRAAVRPS